MVQKLTVQRKKANNKLGVRLKKTNPTYIQPRKIGTLSNPKKPVAKNINQIRQDGTTQQQQQLLNAAINPGGINTFNPFTLVGSALGASVATGENPANLVTESVGLGGVGDLITNLNDPATWLTVLGYIVAIFIIIISLYGIVTSGQQQLINSVIGQNTSGLVKTVKSKKKG